VRLHDLPHDEEAQAEAEDHLTATNANLLSMEASAAKGQATPRQVRELFRSLHTIKGLAAMVGIEPIVEIAHAMEAVLREADRAAGQLPAGAVELLLKGTRAIEQRVQALSTRKGGAPAPAALVSALVALRQSSAQAAGAAASTSLPPDLWTRMGAAEREQACPRGSRRAGGLAAAVRADAGARRRRPAANLICSQRPGRRR
jgi:two-component system chemotaxis sensor kinase CheA